MAIVSIENIKAKFEAGDSPRSSDYIDMIDTLASLPEGGIGPQGPAGANGAAGTNGTNGSNGADAIYDTDQAVISMQVFG
jgi:hypothetical protein